MFLYFRTPPNHEWKQASGVPRRPRAPQRDRQEEHGRAQLHAAAEQPRLSQRSSRHAAAARLVAQVIHNHSNYYKHKQSQGILEIKNESYDPICLTSVINLNRDLLLLEHCRFGEQKVTKIFRSCRFKILFDFWLKSSQKKVYAKHNSVYYLHTKICFPCLQFLQLKMFIRLLTILQKSKIYF